MVPDPMVQEENENGVRIAVSIPDSDGNGDDCTARCPSLLCPFNRLGSPLVLELEPTTQRE